jgi:hypothetical protein
MTTIAPNDAIVLPKDRHEHHRKPIIYFILTPYNFAQGELRTEAHSAGHTGIDQSGSRPPPCGRSEFADTERCLKSPIW